MSGNCCWYFSLPRERFFYDSRCEIDFRRSARSRHCDRWFFDCKYINVQMRASVIEDNRQGCEWLMRECAAREGLKRGFAQRRRRRMRRMRCARNLIYRRLRSVIGLWRVPVRHAVMHEQRPITRNVTIRPGDLCAYPRNYFALEPRVMNTGLNSRARALANPPNYPKNWCSENVYFVHVHSAPTFDLLLPWAVTRAR